MISIAVRMTRVRDRTELAVGTLMVLSFPCAMVAALLANLPLFAAAVAVSYATDWYLNRRDAHMLRQFRRAQVDIPVRFLAREMMLVLLLIRSDLAATALSYAALACFLILHAIHAAHRILLRRIQKRRALPFVSRNIDLTGLHIPPAPWSWLTRSAERILYLDLPAMVGLLVAPLLDEPVYGYLAMAVTLALALGYVAALARYLVPHQLPAEAGKALAFIDQWLRTYRPSVVLYFSGSRNSAYQVNMWLDTVARLDGNPLVILRERTIVPQLDDTTVPVLCVPSSVDLMNLDLSSIRVALYPAHVGKNIHLLREPDIKHVFIGHGDSDKFASVNPFTKVYDEVWTAGRAGRDRFALADVGVRDEDIVEVGRPQLSRIRHGAEAGDPDRIPTVLYAPTWEGWTDEPGNTSVLGAGEKIVRKLLAADPPVRVLYKPHPLTGTRHEKAARRNERIVALLRKASAKRAADPRFAAVLEREAAPRAAATAELAEIEARLKRLSTATRTRGDEADDSRDSMTDPAAVAEAAELRDQWNSAYWRAVGSWEHHTVNRPLPHLYECFNVSDAMVADISSVVSDFVASGKPYAIADSAGLGEVEFKNQNTAARAAVILDNDATQLDQLLAAIGDDNDPLRVAREELREYLLGAEQPTATERFGRAVRALAAKAEARLRRSRAQHSSEEADDELVALAAARASRWDDSTNDGDREDPGIG